MVPLRLTTVTHRPEGVDLADEVVVLSPD